MFEEKTKEIRWFKGRKLIDVWHIDQIKDLAYDGAITPVMIADKHGNIWSMGVTRCDLILTVNMVDKTNND